VRYARKRLSPLESRKVGFCGRLLSLDGHSSIIHREKRAPAMLHASSANLYCVQKKYVFLLPLFFHDAEYHEWERMRKQKTLE
jgi:hypothetical protein